MGIPGFPRCPLLGGPPAGCGASASGGVPVGCGASASGGAPESCGVPSRLRGAQQAAARPKIAAWEELATAREDPRPAHAREGSRRPLFRGRGGVSHGLGGVSRGLGGLRGSRDSATWGNAAGEPRRRATRGERSSQTAKSGPPGGPSCVRRGLGAATEGAGRASRPRACAGGWPPAENLRAQGFRQAEAFAPPPAGRHAAGALEVAGDPRPRPRCRCPRPPGLSPPARLGSPAAASAPQGSAGGASAGA